MAKIERKTQKIFANNTSANQITAFGTAKNTSPEFTTDVAEIQTDIYLQGWSPSLVSDLAPFMQDSNALWYMATKQLSYLFQEGIAEWDSETEYHKGSLVKITDGIYCNIYKSIVDNNIAHLTNDATYWSLYIADSNMAHYPIGDLRFSLNNSKLANEIFLEGQTVSRTTYAKLFAIFGTTYGAGDGSTTFVLPNFKDRVIWGASSANGYLATAYPTVTVSPTSWGTTGSYPGTITAGRLVVGSGVPESKETLESLKAAANTRTASVSGNLRPPAIKVRVKTRWY